MSTVAHSDSTVMRTARAREIVAIERTGDVISTECPIATIVYPHDASSSSASSVTTPNANHEDDSERESVVEHTYESSVSTVSRHE